MTEQAAEQTVPTSAPPSTGIASLDAVLERVAALDAEPLADHADVFEAAHAELRRPLDHPPAAPVDPTDSA
jgi:hypothetical protein